MPMLFILQLSRTAANTAQLKINNINPYSKSINNGARGIEYGSFDRAWNAEHNGIGFVEISNTFVTQCDFFVGAIQFGTV